MPIPPGKRTQLEQELRTVLVALKLARMRREAWRVAMLEHRLDELLDELCELLAAGV